MLRTFVSVERDGISVHLILYVCEDVEQFGVGLHANNHRRETIKQLVRSMLVVLRETSNSDVKMQFVLHNLSHHFHLSLSTVGNDEVG